MSYPAGFCQVLHRILNQNLFGKLRIMSIQQDPILWLQEWYMKQSNNVWEHSYGIKIDTIDNPGWMLSVDLKDTLLEGVVLENTSIERSDNDWVHYKILNNQFLGYGGPENLSELIIVFRSIYDKKQQSDLTPTL